MVNPPVGFHPLCLEFSSLLTDLESLGTLGLIPPLPNLEEPLRPRNCAFSWMFRSLLNVRHFLFPEESSSFYLSPPYHRSTCEP